jgi:phenylpropionate dioxygenase-like ring-hydroxylating dioxygenase large terminal subunit
MASQPAASAGTLTAGEQPRAPYRPGAVVLRDAWYGLAPSSELRRSPIARTIDSTPIVLWRDSTGAARAMEDRCAHRRTPLSAGKVVDGVLQCPYHGWCYDGDGIAVRIPSLRRGEEPPARFGVPAYPVVERYGIVWLWWGDAAAADERLVPDIPFLARDGGTGATFSTLRYSAPQELVVENLLDLTHVDFIHGAVFGDPGGGDEEITVEHTDEIIVMRRVSYDRRPPKVLAPVMGNPGRQDIVQTFLIHVRSGVSLGVAWNTPPGWGFCLLLCNTPETPTTTRPIAAALVKGGPWWYRKISPILSRTVVARQDERIFRLQTPRYVAPDARADRSVPADAAGLRYRSLRAALTQRQAEGDFAYREGWNAFDARTAIYADGPPPRPHDPTSTEARRPTGRTA